MKKARLPIIILAGVLMSFAAGVRAQPLSLRPPALAGAWYPASPERLRSTVEAFLKEAKPVAAEGRLCALVAPHAGYEYSGKVAGWAFRQVGKGQFDRVIIVAPSHTAGFRGFSIMNVSAFQTPLGAVPLDMEACARLRKHDLHVRQDAAQQREHSIEIEIPFLQVALGEFKLVPIMVGSLGRDDAEQVAAALRPVLSRETLVVVSSDFTHYGPRFDYLPFTKDVEQNLRALDMGAVNLIVKKDYSGYTAYLAEKQATICGQFPIAVLLKLLPADATGQMLKYDTSGRITGDWENSVSYVSAMFTAPESAESGTLSPDEKKTLLRIARDTVERVVRTGKTPEIAENAYPLTPRLKERGAVFVTLQERGDLRGCIGRIAEPKSARDLPPLYKSVAMMAVESATGDPRFDRVRPEELKNITIEISVLSMAAEVKGPEEFKVGRDGIIIRKGFSSAVFLPQVAPEQGWTRDETLRHLCQKAGLPPDEWQKPGMKFFTFTAQVFGEKDLVRGSGESGGR